MATLVPFAIDLTAHEGKRLAAVLNALGPLWNPAQIDAGEAQAHQMLYAHLDPEQQAIYDVLLAAGAIDDPPREAMR